MRPGCSDYVKVKVYRRKRVAWLGGLVYMLAQIGVVLVFSYWIAWQIWASGLFF